jgi:predicted amidohydrolase
MKIAGVQMDVLIGDVAGNLERLGERFREAVKAGAKLVAFPECAVTGYCFRDLDEARPFAQSIPGPATDAMTRLCKDAGAFAVFGMLEAEGQQIFNAAVLTGPDGVIGSYRKVHLPFLGVDKFVNYGERPFAVHTAGDVKVGMNICYDAAFPEASRSMAIQGADLIVLPTNWPPGAECVASHVINTRAMENAVYFLAVNRVGPERGFEFIGGSRICAPDGSTLASADNQEEQILYADIDPAKSRQKTAVRKPGEHAIDRMADRRPEMYGDVVKPHKLKRPGRDS